MKSILPNSSEDLKVQDEISPKCVEKGGKGWSAEEELRKKIVMGYYNGTLIYVNLCLIIICIDGTSMK